jgi:uncharacterized protein involved in type VI secretion and phage assembly
VDLPSQFTLHFYDPLVELFDARVFKVGVAITIGFRSGSSTVNVLEGEVTSVALEQGIGTRSEFVVGGFDKSHRLHRVASTRTFINQTSSAIATAVASTTGLTASVEATSEQHEYVVQTGQSDYAFLKALASRIGYHFWASGSNLNFKKRPAESGSPITLTWQEDLMKVRVRASGLDRADEVTVRAWGATSKAAITGSSATDNVSYVTASVKTNLATDSASLGTAKRFATHVPVDTAGDATALANAIRVRHNAAGVILRGEAVGDPNLGAGREVTIAGVASDVDGTYLLTNVEHVYDAEQGYITRFTSGGADGVELPDLLISGSADGVTLGPAWGGLVPGVVTNVNDPNTMGRVKVKIPTLGDTVESRWARVASPGGGPTRGLMLVPEVNDEVLVGFEFGDVNRPVILGGLWNGTDAVPDTAAAANGKVAKRIWKSRTGHKIVMDDDDSAPLITIEHKSGTTKLTLTKDGITVTSDKPVNVKGSDLTVEATGKLTLKGQSVEVKSTSSMTLQASADMTVKGSVIKLN